MTLPKFLNRQRAAEYIEATWGLPCSPRTLAKLASVGGGPMFHKALGVAVYEPQSLDIWAQSKISSPLARASDAPALAAA
jgi:hypothetical protein